MLHEADTHGVRTLLALYDAGAAITDPRATIAVAIIAALVYHITKRLQLHYGIDDAVNAAPVYFWCGIWGMLAASLMLDNDLFQTWMGFNGVDDPTQCKCRGQFIANFIFSLVFTLWVSRLAILGSYNGIAETISP